MTTSSLSDNANSSSSPKPQVDESVAVEMIATRMRGNDLNGGACTTDARIVDMSSPMRSAVTESDEFRTCNGQTNPLEDNLKHSEQWMVTGGNAHHVTTASAIHRKSFNIDALLAKSSQTGGRENSPDSVNDCYNEDRRDFTPSPSPDGQQFR